MPTCPIEESPMSKPFWATQAAFLFPLALCTTGPHIPETVTSCASCHSEKSPKPWKPPISAKRRKRSLNNIHILRCLRCACLTCWLIPLGQTELEPTWFGLKWLTKHRQNQFLELQGTGIYSKQVVPRKSTFVCVSSVAQIFLSTYSGYSCIQLQTNMLSVRCVLKTEGKLVLSVFLCWKEGKADKISGHLALMLPKHKCSPSLDVFTQK